MKKIDASFWIFLLLIAPKLTQRHCRYCHVDPTHRFKEKKIPQNFNKTAINRQILALVQVPGHAQVWSHPDGALSDVYGSSIDFVIDAILFKSKNFLCESKIFLSRIEYNPPPFSQAHPPGPWKMAGPTLKNGFKKIVNVNVKKMWKNGKR